MVSFALAGHSIQFADCGEVGQGGPEVCTMRIDGRPLVRRFLWGLSRPLHFHPAPLEYEGDILVPLREATLFHLVRIDPLTLKLRRLSRGFAYMRLLRVAGEEVLFSTWWDDREIERVRLG